LGEQNSQSGKPSSKQSGRKRNRRRRPNNRKGNRNTQSKGPKLTGFEKVERGYLNLLEKHLESRKKYYALFHRADPRQLAKLERSFYRTLEELRTYEENIKPEFKEEFNAKYDGLKQDTTYSTNHELDPGLQEPEVHEIEDPHLLPTQVDHEFKGDEEESVGSIDDYNKYKGL